MPRQILAPFDEPLVIENQQQTVVALLKPRFNAADQLGQVAVLEDGHAEVPRGGDQQPDLFGPVHENAAGVEIRDVAESLHRLPYALAHLRRDAFRPLRIVEHARNRADRHPGQLRDIPYGTLLFTHGRFGSAPP